MGSAVALGLANAGAKVLMLDKVSRMHTASRANFGLVWSQSKGVGISHRPYARWSEKAVRMFTDFTRDIKEESSTNIELRLGKGLVISLGEKEFGARKSVIKTMHQAAEAYGEKHPSRIVDRNEVKELVGKATLGEEVTGGSYSPIDGDVNPLLLLKAMRKVFVKRGGFFIQGCSAERFSQSKNGYLLTTQSGDITCNKIVLAAGLGNIQLCSTLGIDIPLVPQKGQVLVTQKLKPFLSFPFSGLRQAECGTVMIGFTQENTGFENSTTVPEMATLAKRAVKIFPALQHAQVTRAWASLRVLTKDGLPIYDQVAENVYLLATHSGVTLAPVHAQFLPKWILEGVREEEMDHFQLRRFDV